MNTLVLTPIPPPTIHSFAHSQFFTSPAIVKTLGQQLWNILELPNTLDPCHLIINTPDSWSQQLPWEWLYHPHIGFLGQHPNYSISRTIPSPNPSLPSFSPNCPLQLLLFSSQPKWSQLNSEFDRDYLYNTVNPHLCNQTVQLHLPSTGTFSSLTTLLTRQSWDLVILTGHSTVKQGQFHWIFENSQGHNEAIPVAQLKTLFQTTTINCLILAACQTAYPLAYQLAQLGIPTIIAMQGTLLDRAGSVFIQQFVQVWLSGLSIHSAVQQARQALMHLLKSQEIWQSSESQNWAITQWWRPLLITANLPKEHNSQTLFPQKTQQNGRSIPQNPSFLAHSHTSIPFFGRRQALQILEQSLNSEQIRGILIKGRAGLGKSSLIWQLGKILTAQSYRVIHATQVTEELLNNRAHTQFSDKILIWDRNLTANSQWLTQLDHWQSQLPKARLIFSTQDTQLSLPHFQDYPLGALEYFDFYRYIRYLGFPHSNAQIRAMYQILGGNLQGIQLLYSLPFYTQPSLFKQQLAVVKRYLQALSSSL